MNIENLKSHYEARQWSIDDAAERIVPSDFCVLWLIGPIGHRYLVVEKKAWSLISSKPGIRAREVAPSLVNVYDGETQALEALRELSRTPVDSQETIVWVSWDGSTTPTVPPEENEVSHD